MTTQQTTPVGAGVTSRAVESARHAQVITATDARSRGEAVYLNGACVGYILGDVFERLFVRSVHLLRNRSNALCLHRSLVDRLEVKAVAWIDAIDECGAHHWLPLADFRRIGIPVTDPNYGAQLGVPIRYWRPSKTIATTADPEPAWSQGTLL